MGNCKSSISTQDQTSQLDIKKQLLCWHYFVFFNGENKEPQQIFVAVLTINYAFDRNFSGLLRQATRRIPSLRSIVSKPSQKAESPLILTATELFDNLAKLILPPHRHRHHYHGVLAANSKRRSKLTQFANQYYRPDAAENMELQGDLKIEAAVSKLDIEAVSENGLKNLGEVNSEGV